LTNPNRAFDQPSAPYIHKGISYLSFYQFRNYSSLDLPIEKGPIVLTGPNGAGKTNVLEAISLFSPGRGLRGAKLSEMIPHHLNPITQPGLLWGASLQLDDETQLATGLEKTAQGTEKRLYKIHYEPVKSQAAFGEWLNIVWLTPETDRIFLEAPALRRKFIDRLIYAEDPLHVDRVQRYEHALKERLMVLRNQNDQRWLAGLEEQLATYGVAIAVARQQLMNKLNKSQEYHHNLFPTFYSHMVGEIDCWVEEKSATEAEVQLKQTFYQNRRTDQESGTTKCGPHRSDWQVIHQDKKIAAELASTGEQKILLMAVILSFIQHKVRSDHRLTILLLDDVIAHLDFHHRVVLFEQISALQFQHGLKSHIQTWLTGTDSLLFESLIGRAQFFMVEHATITSG
jgi:DNA replication and repair protein RecF